MVPVFCAEKRLGRASYLLHLLQRALQFQSGISALHAMPCHAHEDATAAAKRDASYGQYPNSTSRIGVTNRLYVPLQCFNPWTIPCQCSPRQVKVLSCPYRHNDCRGQPDDDHRTALDGGCRHNPYRVGGEMQTESTMM